MDINNVRYDIGENMTRYREILECIVQRLNGNFKDDFILHLADSHFRTSAGLLLMSDNLVVSKSELYGIVETCELELGVNCHPYGHVIGTQEFRYTRLLNVFPHNIRYTGTVKAVILDDYVDFVHRSTSRIACVGDVMYVYPEKDKILVSNYKSGFDIEYVRWIEQDDRLFSDDIFDMVSLRVIGVLMDMTMQSISGNRSAVETLMGLRVES